MIVNIFRNRPRGRYVPATEVLFRFDAGAVSARGVVHSARDYPARAGTIAALDRAARGTWWRVNDDRSLNNEQYVDWFMGELLDRICKEAGCSGWNTEVWQRQGRQPVYYLIFLTRHREEFKFSEKLSALLPKSGAVRSSTKQSQTLLPVGNPCLWTPTSYLIRMRNS